MGAWGLPRLTSLGRRAGEAPARPVWATPGGTPPPPGRSGSYSFWITCRGRDQRGHQPRRAAPALAAATRPALWAGRDADATAPPNPGACTTISILFKGRGGANPTARTPPRPVRAVSRPRSLNKISNFVQRRSGAQGAAPRPGRDNPGRATPSGGGARPAEGTGGGGGRSAGAARRGARSTGGLGRRAWKGPGAAQQGHAGKGPGRRPDGVGGCPGKAWFGNLILRKRRRQEGSKSCKSESTDLACICLDT